MRAVCSAENGFRTRSTVETRVVVEICEKHGIAERMLDCWL